MKVENENETETETSCVAEVESASVRVDDGQPTALVPLTEEQEDAMESIIFQDLLRHCGLYPPPTEQVPDLIFLTD